MQNNERERKKWEKDGRLRISGKKEKKKKHSYKIKKKNTRKLWGIKKSSQDIVKERILKEEIKERVGENEING